MTTPRPSRVAVQAVGANSLSSPTPTGAMSPVYRPSSSQSFNFRRRRHIQEVVDDPALHVRSHSPRLERSRIRSAPHTRPSFSSPRSSRSPRQIGFSSPRSSRGSPSSVHRTHLRPSTSPAEAAASDIVRLDSLDLPTQPRITSGSSTDRTLEVTAGQVPPPPPQRELNSDTAVPPRIALSLRVSGSPGECMVDARHSAGLSSPVSIATTVVEGAETEGDGRGLGMTWTEFAGRAGVREDGPAINDPPNYADFCLEEGRFNEIVKEYGLLNKSKRQLYKAKADTVALLEQLADEYPAGRSILMAYMQRTKGRILEGCPAKTEQLPDQDRRRTRHKSMPCSPARRPPGTGAEAEVVVEPHERCPMRVRLCWAPTLHYAATESTRIREVKTLQLRQRCIMDTEHEAAVSPQRQRPMGSRRASRCRSAQLHGWLSDQRVRTRAREAVSVGKAVTCVSSNEVFGELAANVQLNDAGSEWILCMLEESNRVGFYSVKNKQLVLHRQKSLVTTNKCSDVGKNQNQNGRTKAGKQQARRRRQQDDLRKALREAHKAICPRHYDFTPTASGVNARLQQC